MISPKGPRPTRPTKSPLPPQPQAYYSPPRTPAEIRTPPPSPDLAKERDLDTDAYLARLIARHPDLPPLPPEVKVGTLPTPPMTPPRRPGGIPGWPDSPERPLPPTPPIHQMPLSFQMLDWGEPPDLYETFEEPETPPFQAPDVTDKDISDFLMPNFLASPPRTMAGPDFPSTPPRPIPRPKWMETHLLLR
ncbi:unnamed protein product [Diabrotica balteata]|uniref:Uncharacterized protein n=1 Tax=Diabrotica balteata TaxID=107213 RepID=A0A9N9XIW3_DIABA|nr:unnamed protein product [Diabrotica balteata]